MAANHWQIMAKPSNSMAWDAQDLWDAACIYFKWCDDNPLGTKKAVSVGKDAGKNVTTEIPRPYTVKGFCLSAGVLEEYLRDVRQSKDKMDLFYITVSRILYVIAVQNIELAMIGVYNSIFVSKILNIGTEDIVPSAVKVTIVGDLPPLSTSENEILNRLEPEIFNPENPKEQ